MSEATKYTLKGTQEICGPSRGKHAERSRMNIAAAAEIRDSGMRGPNRPSLYGVSPLRRRVSKLRDGGAAPL